MAIKRITRLKTDEDITARNLEKMFDEMADDIPTASDYGPVKILRGVIGKEVPSGLQKGELVVDEASSPPALCIRLSDGRMYKVNDLTEL